MKAFETKIQYVRKRKQDAFVRSSEDAEVIFKPFFKDCLELHEEFYAAFFDRSNNLIAVSCFGKGERAGTVVNKIGIYQTAILSNCSSVILAHNHPSGNLKPSNNDLKLTKEVKAGLELLGFNLLDHLILSYKGCYSFADNAQI